MQAQCPISWQPAPDSPALEPDQIHVWRLQIPHDFPEGSDWLTAGERERLSAMADADGRRHFLALRYALRQVLAAYLGCGPEAVALTTREGGKPAVFGGPEFNLSHHRDLVLLAVAGQPVGIDVERLRPVPRRLAVARRVLGERAADALADLPEGEQDAAFLEQWTAMEARQKCHGEGVFGRRVRPDDVGRCAFVPVEGALASLAWMHPDSLPQIHFFAR